MLWLDLNGTNWFCTAKKTPMNCTNGYFDCFCQFSAESVANSLLCCPLSIWIMKKSAHEVTSMHKCMDPKNLGKQNLYNIQMTCEKFVAVNQTCKLLSANNGDLDC